MATRKNYTATQNSQIESFMVEMSFAYWNELASQLILLTSLLTGFSIAVVANLIVSEAKNRITEYLLRIATVAAGCFLVSVFGMTSIVLITTEGYPLQIDENTIQWPQIIAGSTLMLGLLSLSALIGLSGWTKSRSVGIFTTIVGILTLLAILSIL